MKGGYRVDLGGTEQSLATRLAVAGAQPSVLNLEGTFAKSYYGRQFLVAGIGTD